MTQFEIMVKKQELIENLQKENKELKKIINNLKKVNNEKRNKRG